MGFSYSGDPSASDLDYVRFKIDDTVVALGGVKPGGANIEDEEINAIIAVEDTVNMAIASVFETLAAAWARYVDTKIGSRDEKTSKVTEHYQAQAKKWREDYGFTSGRNVISVGSLDEDISQDDISNEDWF